MSRKMKILFQVLVVVSLIALVGCGTSNRQSGNEGSAGNTSSPSSSATPALDYPKKPIEAIVAFNAGGGTDIVARTLLKHAEKYAGTTFVVNNKPGAGGAIGFTAIAQANPDGYTIGMVNPPTLLLHPIQLKDQVKYTLDDFALIANFVTDPGAFVVKADSPYKTLQDFIDDAVKNPGKVKIGYGGPGTSEALALRKFEQANNINLSKVPFEGTSPQLTALLGGHIDIMITNASEINPQYKDKSVRVLAVGAEERIDLMPDVPTYKESGFDYVQVSMRGLAAPKDMDPRQVQFLADVVKRTMEDPEFQQQAQNMSLPLDYLGPEEYKQVLIEMDAKLRSEYEKNPW